MKELNRALRPLSETIDLLDDSSNQILEVMQQQIHAIITSDLDKIDALSELHSSLTVGYNMVEKEFVKEVKKLLSENGRKDSEIRLSALRDIFPDSEVAITGWLDKLSANAAKLQQKHNQILELLEFAMSNNAKTMHSLYSAHSDKNTHYVSNGKRSGIQTGMAVNQEI